jgi:hypothetical protein
MCCRPGAVDLGTWHGTWFSTIRPGTLVRVVGVGTRDRQAVGEPGQPDPRGGWGLDAWCNAMRWEWGAKGPMGGVGLLRRGLEVGRKQPDCQWLLPPFSLQRPTSFYLYQNTHSYRVLVSQFGPSSLPASEFISRETPFSGTMCQESVLGH